jgi:Mannosyltransferase (PIG-V)
MTRLEKKISTSGGRSIARLGNDDVVVIGWTLGLKLLLFVLGIKAVMVFDNGPLHGLHGYLEIWNRWDAPHYLEVARTGYRTGIDLVVYPLFPTLIRGFEFLTRDYLASAFLVSALALVVAAPLLRRLVALDYSPQIAMRACWFFLIFPTAYFLQIGYTESVFLALVFGAFLASRTDRWWLAGLLGMLAAMTRANGLALLPALAVEAGHQFHRTRKWNWSWCWIILVLAGSATFLAINRSVGGSFFVFVDIRRTVFRILPAWPWVGIGHAITDLGRQPSQANMVGGEELFFIGLIIVCAIVSWFRLRPAYATWISLHAITMASVTFIQSTPRYALACFPIVILFAILAEKRFWLGILSAWSLLFFAFFAILFARGWWAF